jgi:hypothetical protein
MTASLKILSSIPVAEGVSAPIDALVALFTDVLKYEVGAVSDHAVCHCSQKSETDLVLLCHEFEVEYPNGHKVGS